MTSGTREPANAKSPESDSNRRPLPYHRPKSGSSGALQDIEDRRLRASEDVGDPGVSSSYGPKAAQGVSGALLVHQLGELLRRRREELDLSQREVAERAGVSHTAIARVEAGRRRISLELFQRVAEALELQLTIRLE
jgi:HTH-type transcriptional regulator/antitoxin HipB